MKKKLKINMPKLTIGGMERALLDLLNNSNICKDYEVDLLIGYNNLEKNYLDMLPKNINVNVLYTGKWGILGKGIVFLKLITQILFPKKYDVSISYAYQHGILALLTRRESKNNIIFIHNDLINAREPKALKKLCKKLKYEKFSKVVCVSECAKKAFLKIYPNYSGNIKVINNYIDYKDIEKKSKEKIDLKKDKKITFLSVARHEDKHKKISRIIDATKKLKDEGYDFKVLLIGDGQDHKLYLDMISQYKVDNIDVLGSRLNPFPYFKIADAFVFSSQYEGYGLVLNEARVLNLPIITTDVADAAMITKEGYGILCENSSDGVYVGMKEFLQNGYKLEKKFDAKKFNDRITKELDSILR